MKLTGAAWILVFGGFVLSAVVGCSRATGAPAGKIALRYMAWGNPEQLDVERQMIADFNRENPDLYVKLFTVPGSSYGQKMTTMLVSGTAPDVMRVDHYNFPALQKKGYFVDMTPLAKADPGFNSNDFYPQAIEEGTVSGKLHGMNALFGGVLIYYNKKMFKAAGLDDPYELYKQGKWTWDRFLADAKRLTQSKDGRVTVFGTEIPGYPTSVPLIRSFGGELMNDNMTESRVGSSGSIAGFQFLADLIWKDKVAPTPAQGANSAYTFESGQIAMTFNWMGMTPRYRTLIKDFDWDVCPVPAGPAGGATIVKGNQLVIARNSRHPKEAWRFIRFLTGVSTERKLYAEIRRSFPTRRAVAESTEFLKTTESPYNTRAFITAIEGGKPLPISDRWAEWTQILTAEIDNLTSGRERSAAVALKRAEAKINQALSEAPGY